MITYQPESLGVWDRVFNRHKKIPVETGNENWNQTHRVINTNSVFNRDFVVYHIVDRLTGAYTISKEYLN